MASWRSYHPPSPGHPAGLNPAAAAEHNERQRVVAEYMEPPVVIPGTGLAANLLTARGVGARRDAHLNAVLRSAGADRTSMARAARSPEVRAAYDARIALAEREPLYSQLVDAGKHAEAETYKLKFVGQFTESNEFISGSKEDADAFAYTALHGMNLDGGGRSKKSKKSRKARKASRKTQKRTKSKSKSRKHRKN